MTNPPGNPNIRNIGFGSRPREVDDEYRSRIKGVPRKRVWTKEKCIEQLEDLMEILNKKIDKDNFKELSTIVDKMMDIIKYLYPPIQQSKNLNVNLSQESSAENLQKIWLEVQDERTRDTKASNK